MTRDEAKVRMRTELERDLSAVERDTPIMPTLDGRMLSPNQMMEEVDKGTPIGNFYLDDYIQFSGIDAPVGDAAAPKITPEKRQEILALMQKDLDVAPPGWADKPCATHDDGRNMTPNQLMEEVRNGTDYGNRYAQEWLYRHDALNKMMDEVGSKPDGEKLLDLVAELLAGENLKSRNDKAN